MSEAATAKAEDDTTAKAPAPATNNTTLGAPVAPKKKRASPRKKEAAAVDTDKPSSNDAIAKGHLGSKVEVVTRNPINTNLVNEGIVVKRNNKTYPETRTVRIELNTGGFQDVVCYDEPGQDQQPFWR